MREVHGREGRARGRAVLTITQSMADRLVGAFEAGADWALGAKILSIPRSTLMAAVKRDADLTACVEDARAAADEVVIKALYTKATVDKDTTAMIFWLKNRRPSEWRDRREHAVFDARRVAERLAKQIGVPVEELIAEAEAIAKAAEADLQ
jgi:hypothetical protein